MRSEFPARSTLAVALTAILLVACGKGDAPTTTAPAAATVNGTGLPAALVTTVLNQSAPNLPADQAKQAGRQIVETMIDQELLAQQAMAKKLDKEAKVEHILAANRREILARAYMEQVGAGAAKPTEDETKAFFEANPLVFKERKIYNLRELSVAAPRQFAPELEAQVKKAKSLDEVAAWLKSKQVNFTPSVAAKPAEQLPVQLLPKFASMKDGETVVIATDNGILVVQVAATQSQPADLAAARAFIERTLSEQKKNAAIQAEVKNLRQSGKIEYGADYAPPAPAAAASASASAPAASK